jgi:hypothetical protein
MDEKRQLLRHTLATLAYRAARALEGAPDHFAGFAGAGRMPVQILAHMGDLFEWALSAAVGKEQWRTSQPSAWRQEQRRFFQALGTLDSFLASDGEIHACGPVGHVAAFVRQPHPRGKLLRCGDRGGAGGRGSASRGAAVQIAQALTGSCYPSLAPSHLARGSHPADGGPLC